MAVNYTIHAHVVDIRSDVPNADDSFWVDTNIWYWMSYTRASTSAHIYQTLHYPNYLKQAKKQNSTLNYCGLSLNELAHNIEKTEEKIFDTGDTISVKEFRHNYPPQRSNVVTEVKAAWSTVESIGSLVPITIDAAVISASMTSLDTLLLDGYDIFILEAMRSSGIDSIITDDGDFSSVPGITLFTANSSVISAARTQNMLLAR